MPDKHPMSALLRSDAENVRNNYQSHAGRHMDACADELDRLHSLTAWRTVESAPRQGVVLISVTDGRESRVFVAEATYDDTRLAWTWCTTVGWCGWSRLRDEWTVTGWLPLPEAPE